MRRLSHRPPRTAYRTGPMRAREHTDREATAVKAARASLLQALRAMMDCGCQAAELVAEVTQVVSVIEGEKRRKPRT